PPRRAGERVGHEMGEVEVADADRVDVAQGPDADLGGGPGSYPRDRPQPRVGRLEWGVDESLECRRIAGDRADQVGATTFQTERMERPVGKRRECGRRREHAQSELGGPTCPTAKTPGTTPRRCECATH